MCVYVMWQYNKSYSKIQLCIMYTYQLTAGLLSLMKETKQKIILNAHSNFNVHNTNMFLSLHLTFQFCYVELLLHFNFCISQCSTRPLIGKLYFHGYLISSRFYPTREIHKNFMHVKITCSAVCDYVLFVALLESNVKDSCSVYAGLCSQSPVRAFYSL